MYFLAGGISRENAITVFVLCAAIVLLVLVNAVLVVFLHKHNRKLITRRNADKGQAKEENLEESPEDSPEHNM